MNYIVNIMKIFKNIKKKKNLMKIKHLSILFRFLFVRLYYNSLKPKPIVEEVEKISLKSKPIVVEMEKISGFDRLMKYFMTPI